MKKMSIYMSLFIAIVLLCNHSTEAKKDKGKQKPPGFLRRKKPYNDDSSSDTTTILPTTTTTTEASPSLCDGSICPANAICTALTEPSSISGEIIQCLCADGYVPGDVYNNFGPIQCYNSPLVQVSNNYTLVAASTILPQAESTVLSSLCNGITCPDNAICIQLKKPSSATGRSVECSCTDGYFPGDVYDAFGPTKCSNSSLVQVKNSAKNIEPTNDTLTSLCAKTTCPDHATCSQLKAPSSITRESVECTCQDGYFPGDVYNNLGPVECYNYPLFQVAPKLNLMMVDFFHRNINSNSNTSSNAIGIAITTISVVLEDDMGARLHSASCKNLDAECKISFQYRGYESCQNVQLVLMKGLADMPSDTSTFSGPTKLTVLFNGATVIKEISNTESNMDAKAYYTANCPITN